MRYAILALGLTILAMLVMEFNGRTAELNILTDQKNVVNTQLEQRNGTLSALETRIVHATSEAAVVEWAHVDGHMVRDGEVRVIPVSIVESTQTPTPTVTPTPTPFNNSASWQMLFVGPSSR